MRLIVKARVSCCPLQKGMKKNAYGNIEDLVVDAVVVTSQGVLRQEVSAPRVSSGPSLKQLVLGSEGTLGIITQVLLRVKLLPEVRISFALFLQDLLCSCKRCLEQENDDYAAFVTAAQGLQLPGLP